MLIVYYKLSQELTTRLIVPHSTLEDIAALGTDVKLYIFISQKDVPIKHGHPVVRMIQCKS